VNREIVAGGVFSRESQSNPPWTLWLSVMKQPMYQSAIYSQV